jgi:hypothetical protein
VYFEVFTQIICCYSDDDWFSTKLLRLLVLALNMDTGYPIPDKTGSVVELCSV